MPRYRSLLVLLALVSAAAALAVETTARSARPDGDEAEARRVVTELFRSLNERRYGSTCALLANGYFARGGSRRSQCEIGLRVGFTWSQEIQFELTTVRTDARRTVVGAVADGVPGRVVLVREEGRFRVLGLEPG